VTISLDIIRAVHFVSLMTIFGAESLRALLSSALEKPPTDPLPRGFLNWCAGAALLSALLWLLLVGSELTGRGGLSVDGAWLVARQTLFGRVMLARVTVLVLLATTMPVWSARLPRILLSGIALAAIALTGHAAAAGDDRFLFLRAGNDAVHLLAAGFWFGSLVELVPLAIVHRRAVVDLAPALRVFSLWGTIAVSLLVLAGAINSYLILFGERAHWSPGYVGLLAAKITLAAVMVSLALVNRFHVLPGIEKRQRDSAENLVTSSVLELVVGVLIVIVVSVLGTMAPWMA
jgi:putative copper resistance protein D